MIRHITTGAAFLLWATMLCPQAQATHIQYVNVADVDNVSLGYDDNTQTGDTWSWTFDLLEDDMFLWEIDTHYDSNNITPIPNSTTPTGSYDSYYDLHYVTLRIDPNKDNGTLISEDIGLEVNGTVIANWGNPIRLYDWTVPIGDPPNKYGIGINNNYEIIVTLTGLNSLGSDIIPIDNVNLEGCFDAATPVPEPATMLLFGSGLAGLAGWRRKKAHQASRN